MLRRPQQLLSGLEVQLVSRQSEEINDAELFSIDEYELSSRWI